MECGLGERAEKEALVVIGLGGRICYTGMEKQKNKK
jgi:hypothetical protein